MNKKGRMFIVTIAIMIQVMLGVLYGFSKVSVPPEICFCVWCVCAVMSCRLTGTQEVV